MVNIIKKIFFQKREMKISEPLLIALNNGLITWLLVVFALQQVTLNSELQNLKLILNKSE